MIDNAAEFCYGQANLKQDIMLPRQKACQYVVLLLNVNW